MFFNLFNKHAPLLRTTTCCNLHVNFIFRGYLCVCTSYVYMCVYVCMYVKNLYNITKNYFSQRTAILSTNSIRMKTEVSRGCPQGSCCGPGFWNIRYNSLLNLHFTRRTKAVAFAHDLILVISGQTVSEAENLRILI